MSKKISISLSEKSIQNAIKELNQYKDGLWRKNQILVDKLSKIGLEVVQQTMESVPDKEKGSYYTEILNNSQGDIIGAVVRLSGDSVLFLEFSAGITYGTDSYPLPSGSRYGVGTYPGQTHAFDKNGWWYIDKRGEKHHSYGNRAYMPMYHAEQAIIIQIRTIAKEVFGR